MPCPIRHRSRSACSSSAGSGRRTRRSMAASATPICRSGKSPIRTPASTAPAGVCCSAPRSAVQAPVLGGGRGDLWRHQLHRSADPANRLSEHRLQQLRQGCAARRLDLQFKRRFWEEDEAIYGGISYTDLPIRQIAYPNTGFNSSGRGVLLGAYIFDGPNAYEFTSMPPAERVTRAVELGASLHPQYPAEYENGIAIAWHRVPFTLGCAGNWSESARAEHYDHLCRIDGRIVLAGEHASYIPAWQEGAILSSLNAITRLHDRVVKT